MTNLALLFSVDPEIPRLLRSLVLMCGAFTDRVAWQPAPKCEWNARNDPHAAEIVYRAPVRQHRSLGLDVTTRGTMKAEQFREKCQAPLLRPVLDFANVWFESADTVTFHDPLAATTIFDETICTFESGTVEVELDDKQLAGKTYWHSDTQDPRHEIALEVQPERFMQAYFGVF